MKYSLTFLLLFSCAANAKTWQVGPTRQYTAPSEVAPLVADGDTVLIDSGLYTGDVATWSNNNLVLRCPNGMARFNANGNIAGDKGIWVVYGKNTYMEGFEFYGAAISFADGDNGAGIRVQGDGFTCRRCYFHDNQEGILTGNDTTNNDILIEACEFDHNGVEGTAAAGYEHNIYIGLCSSCTIKFCYFHASVVGHEVKCRSNRSYILYNYIVDGPTGDGSLSIDIPQGGLAYVIGNSIEKGPNTENSTVIGYGEEGFKNPDTDFYFINNTIVTNRNPTTYFEIAAGTKTALIANNIIAGTGHPIVGFTDTESNVIETDTSFFHFADPTNYDYHLTENFPGLQTAVSLGSVKGFLLTPVSEYVAPMDSASRIWESEAGAFNKIYVSPSFDSIAIIKNFPDITCSGNVDTAFITVTNTSAVATAYNTFITESNTFDFVLLSMKGPAIVPHGGVDTFLVTFTPLIDTASTLMFKITGNSGSDSIVLRASGGTPIISGSVADTVPLGNVVSFVVKVCNTGTCTCNLGIPVVTSPFAYIAGALSQLQAGECETLEFTFDPTAAGTFTEQVQFPASSGVFLPPPNVTISVTATSSAVSQASPIIQLIKQNYPNPFTTETIIPLHPNTLGNLELFDLLGNRMEVKFEQTDAGIIIERGNLPEGIYFYRITEGEWGTIAEGSVVIGN